MADTTRDFSAGAEPMTARLEAVDQQMVRIIQSLNSTPARDAALYHLETGGHRMRARLALASTADWNRHDDAVLAAAACELLHNAFSSTTTSVTVTATDAVIPPSVPSTAMTSRSAPAIS